MSASAFTRINVFASIAAAALLLFLFIYPRAVLTELTDLLCAGAEDAIDRVMHDEWEAANAGINAMADAFQNKKEHLKLFLNHEDLDMLGEALEGCRQLIEVGEDKHVVYDLARVINIAAYLAEIERFTVYNLF